MKTQSRAIAQMTKAKNLSFLNALLLFLTKRQKRIFICLDSQKQSAKIGLALRLDEC